VYRKEEGGAGVLCLLSGRCGFDEAIQIKRVGVVEGVESGFLLGEEDIRWNFGLCREVYIQSILIFCCLVSSFSLAGR
jgi:hypothetical protein